jgi:hypothetical protein
VNNTVEDIKVHDIKWCGKTENTLSFRGTGLKIQNLILFMMTMTVIIYSISYLPFWLTCGSMECIFTCLSVFMYVCMCVCVCVCACVRACTVLIIQTLVIQHSGLIWHAMSEQWTQHIAEWITLPHHTLYVLTCCSVLSLLTWLQESSCTLL